MMGPSPLRGRSCPQADTQENGDKDKNYPQEEMEWKHRWSDFYSKAKSRLENE
jgi:hypothetical protein